MDPEPFRQVRQFLRLLLPSKYEGCQEMRVYRARWLRRGTDFIANLKYKTTMSGWNARDDHFINDAERLRGDSGYVTINPVYCDLMYRVSNNLRRLDDLVTMMPRETNNEYGNTTEDYGDTHKEAILCRGWALFNIDAVRRPDRDPYGTATEDEHGRALTLRDRILTECPDPAAAAIWGSSCNGGWILLRFLDLPNDAASKELVKRFLAEAAQRFGFKESGTLAYIDTSPRLADAAYMIGVPGKMKSKGANTEDRPWRMMTLHSPLGRTPIPIDLTAYLDCPKWAEPRAKLAALQPSASRGKSATGSATRRTPSPRSTPVTQGRAPAEAACVLERGTRHWPKWASPSWAGKVTIIHSRPRPPCRTDSPCPSRTTGRLSRSISTAASRREIMPNSSKNSRSLTRCPATRSRVT
jgi:hypothetical protein